MGAVSVSSVSLKRAVENTRRLAQLLPRRARQSHAVLLQLSVPTATGRVVKPVALPRPAQTAVGIRRGRPKDMLSFRELNRPIEPSAITVHKTGRPPPPVEVALTPITLPPRAARCAGRPQVRKPASSERVKGPYTGPPFRRRQSEPARLTTGARRVST